MDIQQIARDIVMMPHNLHVFRDKSFNTLITESGYFESVEYINEKSIEDYFKSEGQRIIVSESLQTSKTAGTLHITVKVIGGGVNSQAEAIRHALARILIKMNPEERKDLKKAGFLKRDPRAKERRKFGLKKARKAPQWSKR